MPVTCPAGHQSETRRLLRRLRCGRRSPERPPPPPPPASDPGRRRPRVAAPARARRPLPGLRDAAREPDDAFCEVCGLDFATGLRPAPPPPPAPAAAAAAAPTPAAAPTGWTAVVEVDPAFFATNQPDDAAATFTLPAGTPPREIPLAGDEVLIGRARRPARAGRPSTSASPPRTPACPTATPGSSGAATAGWSRTSAPPTAPGRRRAPHPIAPGTAVALADGDHLLLGVWTRITLAQARPGGVTVTATAAPPPPPWAATLPGEPPVPAGPSAARDPDRSPRRRLKSLVATTPRRYRAVSAALAGLLVVLIAAGTGAYVRARDATGRLRHNTGPVLVATQSAPGQPGRGRRRRHRRLPVRHPGGPRSAPPLRGRPGPGQAADRRRGGAHRLRPRRPRHPQGPRRRDHPLRRPRRGGPGAERRRSDPRAGQGARRGWSTPSPCWPGRSPATSPR